MRNKGPLCRFGPGGEYVKNWTPRLPSGEYRRLYRLARRRLFAAQFLGVFILSALVFGFGWYLVLVFAQGVAP